MSRHVFGQWYPASDPPEKINGSEIIVASPFGSRWFRSILRYETGQWRMSDEGMACAMQDDEFWMPAPPPPAEAAPHE